VTRSVFASSRLFSLLQPLKSLEYSFVSYLEFNKSEIMSLAKERRYCCDSRCIWRVRRCRTTRHILSWTSGTPGGGFGILSGDDKAGREEGVLLAGGGGGFRALLFGLGFEAAPVDFLVVGAGASA